jgi:hypothetical protein
VTSGSGEDGRHCPAPPRAAAPTPPLSSPAVDMCDGISYSPPLMARLNGCGGYEWDANLLERGLTCLYYLLLLPPHRSSPRSDAASRSVGCRRRHGRSCSAPSLAAASSPRRPPSGGPGAPPWPRRMPQRVSLAPITLFLFCHCYLGLCIWS